MKELNLFLDGVSEQDIDQIRNSNDCNCSCECKCYEKEVELPKTNILLVYRSWCI